MTLILLWIVYFVTTVVGYVGMKFAADLTDTKSSITLAPFFHPWGIGAILAWGASSVVWPWILGRQSLVWANALSSFRVPLIAIAACLLLHETLSAKQFLGAGLITLGIVLSK
ncbi:MAG: hypothetical protein U0136_21795 [Bdellovibrionota bacterium]